MANLENFKTEDGIELVIDTITGEAFVTISGYARMSGKHKMTISRRVEGVTDGSVKTDEIQTAGGLQAVTLIPASLVFDWSFDDNPQLAKAMGQAGATVYLCKLAGFSLKPIETEIKPKTTTELLLESVQQLVEFEKKQKELEENQKLLESKLEAQIEKMEAHETWLTGIDAELDRLESPQGHYFSVVGYANLNNVKIGKSLANSLGKKCSAWCRKNGVRKETVNDTMYGQVGSYPVECLEYVFLNEGLITKPKLDNTEFEFDFDSL